MGFTKYKSLGEVLKKYRIKYQDLPFEMLTNNDVPPFLLEDLEFTFKNIAYDSSEASICENIIYPILKTAWKPFVDDFALWSHEPIVFNEELSGIPDYVISKRSELGKVVFEAPFLAVVEAKKDDFTAGWAQCSLEMYSIQQINQTPEKSIFGMVSNGDTWEMASLKNANFSAYRERFGTNDLRALFNAIQTVLLLCKE